MTTSASTQRSWAGWAASATVIIAAWLFAASRWAVTDAVVPWDSKNQFYAFFRFLAASLQRGDSPFWNPYHYGGHPSIADPQSLIFAPAFLVWGFLDPTPSMQAFDLFVYAHLLVGGLAMSLVGHRAGWTPAACVLAAAVFMFGGPAAGRLQHTTMILSYSLFPIALLLLTLAMERRSLLSAAGFGVCGALLALGRHQVALLFCMVLVAVAIGHVASAARPLRYLRERLPVLSTMGIVGAALLVIPMALTLQFASLSNRPTETIDAALKGSVYPANLATLAAANVFGTHGSYWGPDAQTLPETAFADDSFNYLFVGVVPVVVLLWFGVAGGEVWRRGTRMTAGILIVSFLYVLGRYTPFFSSAFEFVPGIDLFRRPADGSFVIVAALALLCGGLLTRYVRFGVPKMGRVASVCVAGVTISLLASAIVFSQRTGHGGAAFAAMAIPALIAAAVVALCVAARNEVARSRVAMALAAITVADLLYWNVAFRLNAEPRSLYAVLEQPAGDEAKGIAVLEDALAEDRRRGERPRVEVLGMGGPWQNLAMVRGWEATNGYNPLRIQPYEDQVAPGEENWRMDQRIFPPTFASYDAPLAKALGLKYLILGQPIESLAAHAYAARADLLFAGSKLWIYRLAGTQPRAVLESPTGPTTAPPNDTERDAAASRPSVAIKAWRPGRVELRTSSNDARRLVLHTTFYPGWVATIDGADAQVYPHGLFQAVDIPAGDHNVAFRFKPPSWSNLTATRRPIAPTTRPAPPNE